MGPIWSNVFVCSHHVIMFVDFAHTLPNLQLEVGPR